MRRAALIALLAAGCGSSVSEVRDEPVPDPTEPPPTGEAPARTRAVVVVVIDQLPTHALETYLPHLSPTGAIRRGISRGAFHRRVVYPYAATYTAPGHAAIYTGAPSSESGVVANQVYDYARAAAVASVDDGQHPILGVPGDFASPLVLRAETVADVLDRATGGRAVVASVSMKDRAAVLGGGRSPDLVLWYERSIPGFTASTYYGDELPGWVTHWQAEHPIDSTLGVWEPDDAALYERLLGPDDAPGEGGAHGLGVTFPHDPRAGDAPYSALRMMPASSLYLLALASEAARRTRIGEDDVVDLLAVSISSIDYAGHTWGPHSWEYADNLIRVDRALGSFLDELERTRGPLAVLITTDHGVATMPERARAEGEPAGRVVASRLAEGLESELDRVLGRGDWVAAFIQPFVYLSPSARDPARRARAVAAATRWLSARPGIEAVFDTREAVGWREAEDPLRRAVGLSVPDEPTGDLYVVPSRGYIVDNDPDGHGSSHGSPWDYDQTVPVIFWGTGVEQLETTEPLDQRRVAPTIAALLGVPSPEHAIPEPLPGAPAR